MEITHYKHQVSKDAAQILQMEQLLARALTHPKVKDYSFDEYLNILVGEEGQIVQKLYNIHLYNGNGRILLDMNFNMGSFPVVMLGLEQFLNNL